MAKNNFEYKWRKLKDDLISDYLNNRKTVNSMRKDTGSYRTCLALNKGIEITLLRMDDVEESQEFHNILFDLNKENQCETCKGCRNQHECDSKKSESL